KFQIHNKDQSTIAYDFTPNPGHTRTLIPFINNIHQIFFSLPQYIVADAGYGSEQNYDDILNNRKRVPLITYNLYRKEKKKKFREDPFNTANWTYHSDTNSYVCPNEKQLNLNYS